MPVGINNSEEVVGWYRTRNFNVFAFLLDPRGGIETFAVSVNAGDQTVPTGINLAGTVTGFFIENNATRGFIRDRNGTITGLDDIRGVPRLINDAGDVAGWIFEGTRTRGFVRDRDGTVSFFDNPGRNHIRPRAINAAGEIGVTSPIV